MPAVVLVLAATGTTAAIGATVGAAIVGSAVSATTAAIIGSAVVGAGVAAASGGDASDVLKGAVLGGVTAGVGSGISSAVTSSLVDAGVNSAVAATTGSAIAGGTTSALRGGDFEQGAFLGGLNTGFNQATDALATAANTPTMNTDDLSYNLPDQYVGDDMSSPLSGNYDVEPADYSLTGDKSNIPTSEGGLNPAGSYTDLNTDSIAGQAPGLNSMGGGSGMSINANAPLGDYNSFINDPYYASGMPTGTVSGAGFIDAGAMPALGDPGSFINNPNVTGKAVIPTPQCAYDINVPNVKLSDLLNRRDKVSRNIASSGYEVTGCSAIPWLDTRADMLRGKVYGEPDKKRVEDIYSRMDADLAREFQDRYGGVPQVNLPSIDSMGSASGLSGGNFARPSGYEHAAGFADGGSSACLNVSGCLNNDTKYMPKFYACTPDMLQTVPSQKRAALTPKQLKHMQQVISPMGNMGGLAQGGLPKKYHEAEPHGHNTEFVTGLTGFYACGGGTGQSDDIPAMLHDGDYVMDADVVAALGDGSSKAGREVLEGFRSQVPHKETGGGKPVPAKIADGEYVFPAGFVTALGGGDNKAGAKILDGLREKLRAHKRSAPTSKIPPKAKSPLDYIKGMKG